MPRNPEWKREVENARRIDAWSLAPPRRLVKAVPLGRDLVAAVQGYVTVEQSLVGQTPRQMEENLGLPAGHFATGCRIYGLTRLPRTGEIEYELTADHPDGLAFDEWGALDEVLQRRLDPSRPSRPIYAPGRRSIHQWRLTSEIPATVLVDLLPNTAFRPR